MTVGQIIYAIRKASGMKQKDLAAACGLDVSGLRKIEKGKVVPSISSLEKIARVLGINPYYLEAGDLDATKAMIHLFRIFRAFDGTVISGEDIKKAVLDGTFDENKDYLSFAGLNGMIASWGMQYDNYNQQIAEAKKVLSPIRKKEKMELAERQFLNYMLAYPETELVPETLLIANVLTEAGDYMMTHPLNDEEEPISEKEKQKNIRKVNEIHKKLDNLPLD